VTREVAVWAVAVAAAVREAVVLMLRDLVRWKPLLANEWRDILDGVLLIELWGSSLHDWELILHVIMLNY
jgi:hypothetical protein